MGSISLSLRLASLVGKLALSLFMGKYFELAELGRYGLAFGAVMLATVLLGFRLDYIVSREISGMDRQHSRRTGTTVLALYLASFVLAAPFALWALVYLGDSGTDFTFLLLVYLICGVEAYANFIYTVTIALKRAALANALFFLRSGAWTIPVILISFFQPEFRTVQFVLALWLAGASLSVLLNLWFTRAELMAPLGLRSLQWTEMRSYIGATALIWIGSVGLALGSYVDRFVLASYLTLDDVGVATFYTSFTAAALALVQSATTSLTFPAMIDHHDAGRTDQFRKEVRRTGIAAGALSLAVLGSLALAMLFMGQALGKPELLAAYPAFLVLLLATWIRTHAETLYYGLFVERKHRAIWLGNLLFLAASLALNIALIPSLEIMGLAIAALAASLVIFAWRGWAFRTPTRS